MKGKMVVGKDKRRSKDRETEVGVGRFDELVGLSKETMVGLEKGGFMEMTAVQRRVIPAGLEGRDILAAAPTGSGKTLAFVVPVLERLCKEGWNAMDGLGALVLSPTRELAMQIFSVMRQVGFRHQLSAGLVTGGKDLEYEKERVGRMNILVATPGRLLQHMDQVVDMDTSRLQVLVLDEADRILDMGFEKTLTAILENLPKQDRQTLLFSATLTRSVSALARLSLKSPMCVSVQDTKPGPATVDDGLERSGQTDHAWVTPDKLEQRYTTVPAETKLPMLWGFIRTHLTKKTIVFVSSCKQVRFIYEVFRRMRPGLSLLELHGRMKQAKRVAMYAQFCRHTNAVLISTDVAARGLDFPGVDWVLQLDCPDSVESYVHRAGRTARFTRTGKSLLVLLPEETQSFLSMLKKAKIEPKQLIVNPSKVTPVSSRVSSIVAADSNIKHLGQRAFDSYLRFLYLQKNRGILDPSKVNQAALAESMGLPSTPKVRSNHTFTKKSVNAFGYRTGQSQKDNKGEGESTWDENPDEEWLVVKKVHDVDHGDPPGQAMDLDLKQRDGKRLKISKQGRVVGTRNTRLVFDDDEDELKPEILYATEANGVDSSEIALHYDHLQASVAAHDRQDRMIEREKRKAKRWKIKEKLRAVDSAELDEEPSALVPPTAIDGSDVESFSASVSDGANEGQATEFSDSDEHEDDVGRALSILEHAKRKRKW